MYYADFPEPLVSSSIVVFAALMIVYISPGVLPNYTDVTPLTRLIRSQNELLRHRVVINTVSVTDSRRAMFYDASILRNIALQHFDSYGVPTSSTGTPLVS